MNINCLCVDPAVARGDRDDARVQFSSDECFPSSFHVSDALGLRKVTSDDLNI